MLKITLLVLLLGSAAVALECYRCSNCTEKPNTTQKCLDGQVCGFWGFKNITTNLTSYHRECVSRGFCSSFCQAFECQSLKCEECAKDRCNAHNSSWVSKPALLLVLVTFFGLWR